MMRRRYPIKHGVKVYGTSAVNSWYVRVSSRDENWNLYENTTWQVRRSDFDAMMLEEAVKRGAELCRGTAGQGTENGRRRRAGRPRPVAGWRNRRD